MFLFLIPFVVDPALATINHDFVKTPVQCRVILNKYILGEIIKDGLTLCDDVEERVSAVGQVKLPGGLHH